MKLKPQPLPWTNLRSDDFIALVSSVLVLKIENLNLALTSDLLEEQREVVFAFFYLLDL